MVAQSTWSSNLSNNDVKTVLSNHRRSLELAVCDSTNYFNLGTLIRTSHNFLLNKIYGVDTKFYKKATMGARKYEDIELCSLDEFVNLVSNKNLVVFERRPGLKSESLFTFEWPENPIIVLGGEKTGVPSELISIAKSVVEIPCFGVLNDFNVASAGAMAIYDWSMKNNNLKNKPQ